MPVSSPPKPAIPPPDRLNLTLDLSKPDFELISTARTLGVAPTSFKKTSATTTLSRQPHRSLSSSVTGDISHPMSHSVTHDDLHSTVS